MMTDQRKKRLRNKIRESRGRLMEQNPFFAILLMYLKFVAVSDINKMSTNGRCIYFSPAFVEKLYCDELDYILCHQIVHILCGHIWIPIDRKGDDYHFACDIATNLIMAELGFEEERYSHLGNVYRKIPSEECEPIDITVEEIYSRIPYSLYLFDAKTRSKYLMDDDLWWSQRDDNGESGEIILDIVEDDCLAKDEETEDGSCGDTALRQCWQGRAASAAEQIKTSGFGGNKSAGDVPEFMKRIIEKMKKPVLDWKKILNNFIQEQTCDYTFAPPDRRFSDTDFFLPDFNEKDFAVKEILFMGDTSGSVDENELTAIYSEIRGALEQFGGRLTGKLGFFDASVKTPYPFESIDDLARIIPYGGGGPDFFVIFDYIRHNYSHNLPACVIIFTDGYAEFPDEHEAMGIPVLWIISNDDVTPPWGRTVRLLPNT